MKYGLNEKLGDHLVFHTSSGDVILRPVFFVYNYCDFVIKDGMEEDAISDITIFIGNFLLLFIQLIIDND